VSVYFGAFVYALIMAKFVAANRVVEEVAPAT